MLIMTQDRCTVCAERTKGPKMELLGDMGHVESSLGLFGDVSVSAR
jgi:hypothetical protein